MPGNLKAHIYLFLVALIYGANYTIAKEVLDGGYVGAFAFVFFRILAGFVLFTFFHLSVIKEKIDRKDLGWIILCSLLGVVLNQVFFLNGLALTTPINASLIMTTTPIIVLVVSALILGEHITPTKIAGILIGAVGTIIIIAYGRSINFSAGSYLGDLFIFLNAISFGIYLVLVKRLMRKYHPITVVRWVFTFGILWVLPFGIEGWPDINWSSFSLGIWVAFFYVLIFTTFFTYLLNSLALQSVNPSVVSIYIYLQPLIASFIALIFAKDELSLIKLFAGILIFVGVFLVSRPTPQQKQRSVDKS